MINMNAEVKNLFPSLYAKNGTLVKREPKKYICSCGHEFSKTQNLKTGGFTFGLKNCEKCGGKGKDSETFNVWKRMQTGQIEQEDFILNTIKEKGIIEKNELLTLVNEQFEKETNALGTLCYFGYLQVNEKKRDHWGVIEYSINPKKDLNKRLELIR